MYLNNSCDLEQRTRASRHSRRGATTCPVSTAPRYFKIFGRRSTILDASFALHTQIIIGTKQSEENVYYLSKSLYRRTIDRIEPTSKHKSSRGGLVVSLNQARRMQRNINDCIIQRNEKATHRINHQSPPRNNKKEKKRHLHKQLAEIPLFPLLLLVQSRSWQYGLFQPKVK